MELVLRVLDHRDGVLVLVLVLVLTRVQFFPVLSNTQCSSNFSSTSTRTYSSTDAKSPVLMSILRVQLSTLLKIYVNLF